MATTWYLAPSLETLWGQVRKTFPGRNTASDGTIGDAAHQAGVSDHNPDPKTGVVRALDVTVTTAQSKRILDATVADTRVAYVIYNRRIWTPARGWYTYTGSNPHTNHIHISLRHNKTAEDSRTPWKGLDLVSMKPLLAGGGRISSPYGIRGGTLHAGADYAPASRSWGEPVYATYAGTVEKVVSTRRPGQLDRIGELAPYRTGNGPIIRNPDGEKQLYGHVKPVVKAGQKIKAGQLLGHIDNSGNTSGPHVHLEIWNKNGTTRNPQGDFRYWGVDPFAAKKPATPAPKPSTPKPSTPTPTRPASGPGAKLTIPQTKSIQRALATMGYDVGPDDGSYKNRTINAVKAYQEDLNKYAGAKLFVDGDWWTVVQRWFDWVKQLQRALPAWRGVPNLVVDGGYQRLTANAVRILQSNNGLHPDGKAGNITCAFMRKHGSNIPNPPKSRP